MDIRQLGVEITDAPGIEKIHVSPGEAAGIAFSAVSTRLGAEDLALLIEALRTAYETMTGQPAQAAASSAVQADIVVDGDGDRWHLKSNGLYSGAVRDNHGEHTLDHIRERWGIDSVYSRK